MADEKIRVVKTTTNKFPEHNSGGDSKVRTEVIWEGTDLTVLSLLYPRSKVSMTDTLGHSEIEDGLVTFDHSFQKKEGDEWVEIDDPRIVYDRRTTAREKAAEAEARRDFPGDFMSDACEDCGDPTCSGECQYGSEAEMYVDPLMDLSVDDPYLP